MKHTTGPWKVLGGTIIETVKDERWICSVPEEPHYEVRANARLIAAAPELLEALEQARIAINVLDDSALGRHPEIGYSFKSELLNRIDTVIAKAKGEEPK